MLPTFCTFSPKSLIYIGNGFVGIPTIVSPCPIARNVSAEPKSNVTIFFGFDFTSTVSDPSVNCTCFTEFSCVVGVTFVVFVPQEANKNVAPITTVVNNFFICFSYFTVIYFFPETSITSMSISYNSDKV